MAFSRYSIEHGYRLYKSIESGHTASVDSMPYICRFYRIWIFKSLQEELTRLLAAPPSLIFHCRKWCPTQTHPMNFLKQLHQLTTGDHPDPL